MARRVPGRSRSNEDESSTTVNTKNENDPRSFRRRRKMGVRRCRSSLTRRWTTTVALATFIVLSTRSRSTTTTIIDDDTDLPFLISFPASVASFSSSFPTRAAARFRAAERHSSSSSSSSDDQHHRDVVRSHFPFPLDDWQVEAGAVLRSSPETNLLVCAPTGAGKTVVGESALRAAAEAGRRAVYATPLKALSNQKYAELRDVFGADAVGLRTGDVSLNRGSTVTVATTEVYRNSVRRARRRETDAENKEEEDDLSLASVVVLDEFHYMGDEDRGGVWEECVIASPPHARIVGLSATLPNAKRLARWMEEVTGRPTKLVSARGPRPVPLRWMFASKEDGVVPLFVDEDAGPGGPREGMEGTRSRKRRFEAKETTLNPKLLRSAERTEAKIDKGVERRKAEIERAAAETDDRGGGGGRYSKNGRRRRKGGAYDGYGDDDIFSRGRRRSLRMSARDERRLRDRLLRTEMKRSVPSLPFLIEQLKRQNLLPAIFFIFSRAGCDDAARLVCEFLTAKAAAKRGGGGNGSGDGGANRDRDLKRDAQGRSFRGSSDYLTEDTFLDLHADDDDLNLLDNELVTNVDDDARPRPFDAAALSALAEVSLLGSLAKVERAAARIDAFHRDNPGIALDRSVVVRLLLGVASHHAGMLPAHKSVVESLFQDQLLRVVFATETLAAGVHMPARTTVLCSMAKRQNRGVALLPTGKVLQMAGRAGRRGLDDAGACVLVSTAFEGATEARGILLGDVEPVVGRFAPSYPLLVNLIARDEQGRLDVARELIGNSFAAWERRETRRREEEREAAVAAETGGDVASAWRDRFLSLLAERLRDERDDLRRGSGGKKFKLRLLDSLDRAIDVLTDVKKLKKESKSYEAAQRAWQAETDTLSYLQRDAEQEVHEYDEENDGIGSSATWDALDTQRKRVARAEIELGRHPFRDVASWAHRLVSDAEDDRNESLRTALRRARYGDEDDETDRDLTAITAEELTTFAKASVVSRRKQNKEGTTNASSLLTRQMENVDLFALKEAEEERENEMLALVRVLEAYGCLRSSPSEDDGETEYEITPAGEDVGALGLDNSLWGLVAMGGAWDVAHDSAGLDEFRNAWSNMDKDFDDLDLFNDADAEDEDWYGELKSSVETRKRHNDDDGGGVSNPKREADDLLTRLLALNTAELAGYVSCLVAEESRRGGGGGIESFRSNLSTNQREAVRSASLAAERLAEVQNKYGVDQSSERESKFLVLDHCDVVTAWAAGCTWSECLETSFDGATAPGDLARQLHRAMDALRQFGNLEYRPVRSGDNGDVVGVGLHPELRRACRDAVSAMNRFPVKDPMPFQDATDEEKEEEAEEDKEGSNNELDNAA